MTSDGGMLRVIAEANTLTFRPVEAVTIGRHPDSAVLIMNSRVSRHHAVCEHHDGRWTLRDLRSSNGTFVLGEAIDEIAVTGPVKVNLGDIDGVSITLAPEILDQPPADDGPTAVVGADAPDRTPTVKLSGGGGPVRDPDNDVITIGRAPGNDIVVDDESVSWYHAEVRPSPDGWELVDLDSSNGSLINGRSVRRGLLQELDLIEIGPRLLRLVGDSLEPVTR